MAPKHSWNLASPSGAEDSLYRRWLGVFSMKSHTIVLIFSDKEIRSDASSFTERITVVLETRMEFGKSVWCSRLIYKGWHGTIPIPNEVPTLVVSIANISQALGIRAPLINVKHM